MNTTQEITTVAAQFAPLIRSDKRELLATDWGQTWTTINSKHMQDQYGFEIIMDPADEKPYLLVKGGKKITRTHRLVTAKLLSCILLNDILMFKKTNDTHETE